MMNEAIEQILKRYDLKSKEDYQNALKEVIQEVILLGLSRAGFFEKTAFYGGTALRILHGLDRFSEDLDFTLYAANNDFKIEKYFPILIRELKSYGFEVKVNRIEKKESSSIESAFLKANTKILFLEIEGAKSFAKNIQNSQILKIKFEVDTSPAVSFDTEIKTLLLPSPFTVKSLAPSSLFAGKMHAILFRNWKSRVKGRDFYDFQWFVARSISIKKAYLEEKIFNSNAFAKPLTKEMLIDLFQDRIKNINWKQAKEDVSPFLKNQSQIELWSEKFFNELIERVDLD